jgi:hypothetical protein
MLTGEIERNDCHDPFGEAHVLRHANSFYATRALAVGMVLSACADAPPLPASSTRDSAGVTIFESAVPAWASGEGWTVDPEPLLDLSTTGTGEAHEFYRVQAEIRLADGSIVVGLSAGDIRIFSASGSFLGAVGGRGEGPGEFRTVTSLHVTGFADAIPIFGRDAHLGVRHGRFLLGSAETMEYRIHTPDGALARIVRVPDYDLAIDEEMLDAERTARLGMNSSPGSRELLSLLPTPSARPAYSEPRVDSEGCVGARHLPRRSRCRA